MSRRPNKIVLSLVRQWSFGILCSSGGILEQPYSSPSACGCWISLPFYRFPAGCHTVRHYDI